MRPLIVGRDPGLPGDPKAIPLTTGNAARRLANLCGLDAPIELADHFELINLFRDHVGSDWDASEAHRRAQNLERLFVKDRRVVLLGSDVARAFNVDHLPYFEWWGAAGPSEGAWIATSPHPSGRARYWNDLTNVEHAQVFFTRLLKEAM